MKSLSLHEYQQLIDRSVVLEQDRHGLKVLETDEGLIVKLFRRKRVLSSALFKPYAVRFIENAQKLKKLGFDTVEIAGLYYCKPIKRALVFYHPLPGETLRTVLHKQECNDELIGMFIRLFAQLHERGVLFRSCHFNNFIVADSMDRLGLIDISDMKIWPTKLSPRQRIRNFRHMIRYKVDLDSIKQFGINRFVENYISVSSLPESCKDQFSNIFK